MDGLIDVNILKVVCLCVSLGTLDTRVRGCCCNIRVGEGRQFLGQDGCLSEIAIGRTNVLN